ncbi:MAG: ribosomal RNA small subunit methyltransferase A [Methanothrix sp.]|nr:MAG: ribosomal RNA small subunit methyltransferase A [Methanothrix sp.]
MIRDRLGQHFLIDRNVALRIASYADLVSTDRVLEIGPGTGNLTEVLAPRVSRVYSVEVDPNLAEGLCGRFSNVGVMNADALTVELPDYNKIVSNLPYQISSKITYRLLSRPFDLAVLMFQREFALRMTAPVGSEKYGRLAMVVGFLCRVEIMETVPKTAFLPVPAVNSAVVRLHPRQVRLDVDVQKFMRLVEGLFRLRRKKVKKGLAALGIGREKLTELFGELDLDPELLEKRPEELTPDEAAMLSRAM